MIEPLTNVVIPDRLAFPGESWTGSGQEQIIILPQVYRNTKCEQNLFEVARKLVRYAGLKLIAVEGHDQIIDEDYLQPFRGKGIEFLSFVAEISGGVLYLKMTSDPYVELWGVDHREQKDAQHQAMNYLQMLEAERDGVFSYLRSQISEAKKRHYSPELLELDKILSLNREERPGLKTQVLTLLRFANGRGLGLTGYPSFAKLIKCFALEDSIDFSLAERQRFRLVADLVSRAYGWFRLTGERVLKIDLEKLEPIAGLWLKQTRRTLHELETEIGERGIEAVLLECRQWLDKWLVGGALKFRHGVMPGNKYYQDLMMLAIRLGIDFYRLRELLKYVKYYEYAASLDRRELMRELDEFTEFVMDEAYTEPEQRRLLDIENKTETLNRGYGVQLTPTEVKSLNKAISDLSSITNLRDEIEKISAKPGALVIPDKFELGLEQAFKFYNLSISRGQFMLENTLKVMKTRGEHRAIIVCGGFHVDVITRHLRDKYSEVGWSVISPNPELSFSKSQHLV